MAIDFQFLKLRLSTIITERIQDVLFTACNPSFAGYAVDHLDTVPNATDFRKVQGRDDQIDAVVPVDIYLVTPEDLQQSVNGTPAGAQKAFGRAAFIVRLTINGARITAQPLDPDLTEVPLPPALKPAVASQLRARLASLAAGSLFDGQPIIQTLGLQVPTVSRFSITGGAVSAELAPSGPPADRLGPGQEWGIFLDAPSAIALALAHVPGNLTAMGLKVTANWAPVGGAPRVTAAATLDLEVVKVVAPVEFRFHILPGTVPVLRIEFGWEIDVKAVSILAEPLAFLGEAALELAIELADDFIADAFGSIGAVRTGDRTYYRDVPLMNLSFMEARLLLTGVAGSPAGMVFGGPAVVSAADRGTLSFKPQSFSRPYFKSKCRTHGEAKPKVKPHQVLYQAGVTFSRQGAYCSVDFDSPGSTAQTLLKVPPAGSTKEPDGVGFDLSVWEAATITKDVRFVLRTARGVRLIDLGRPEPIVLDKAGYVTNVIHWHIPNCLSHKPQKKSWEILLGDENEKLTLAIAKPPFEDPNWHPLTIAGLGIDVNLISLTGLVPGEIVRFRSDSHILHMAAGADGTVLVPTIMPLSLLMAPGALTRLNGKSLEGRFTVRSAALMGGHRFESEGAIGPGMKESEVAQVIGRAREVVSLNPQPLPPEPPDQHPLVRGAGLKEVAAVFDVPGFHDEAVAVVVLADGGKLVLEGDGRGAARVSGVFEGPIGTSVAHGDGTIVSSGGESRLLNRA
jgi:hypothetical protein